MAQGAFAQSLLTSSVNGDGANGKCVRRGSSYAENAVAHSSPGVREPRIADGHVEIVRIAEIIPSGIAEPVFNLTVERQPEYFANGILTHNCSWVPGVSKKSPDRMDAAVYAGLELFPNFTTPRALTEKPEGWA